MGVLKKIFSNEDLASTSASAVATPLSYFQEDENARAWGDELSGELLYTILLKRVRYSKNTGDGLQWETQKVNFFNKKLATNSEFLPIEYFPI